MSLLTSFMIFMIVLGLVMSFAILVYPGADKVPMWFIYAAFPVAAMAGGAAISMILSGVPK